MRLIKRVTIKGKTYNIYRSTRKDKQAMVKYGYRWVHFGDPKMPEYPGTLRGDNYCTRTYGLGKKHNILGDMSSPNFWSRKVLWGCVGKKSIK